MLVVIAKAALVVVSRDHLVWSQEASSRLAAHRRLRRSLMVLLEGQSSEAARHRVFSPEGYTTSSQARQRVRQHLVISCARSLVVASLAYHCVAQESCRSDVLSALQAAHRCIRKLVAVEELVGAAENSRRDSVLEIFAFWVGAVAISGRASPLERSSAQLTVGAADS